MISVVGTDAFMDFVESIKSEGVELERRKMGEGTAPKTPIVVEIDKENTKKDINKLDIQIPVLSPRIYREYKNLSDLDDPLKIERLKQWCDDINKAQTDVIYHCLYIKQELFEKYKPRNFSELANNFRV